ncbi:MAG: hypothetical protein PHU85_01050 [Phycisphaerae bacterium]|nr:hypothetical protein [Phycisphaerae bacterium]
MVDSRERTLIRDLAKRVAEVAALPVQEQRRELWRRHNRLERVRPMILVFPEGAWQELMPDAALQCRDEQMRGIERELRRRLYYHDHDLGDAPIAGDITVGKAIGNSGWRLEAKQIPSTTRRGAWAFDPVLKTATDLKKLRLPVITHDEKKTAERLAFHTELLGDILPIRLVGVTTISFHLMRIYTQFRGLLEAMMDMAEQPSLIHDAMAILEAGHHGIIKQYLQLGLLSLNNDDSYQNSGGVSFSTELPRPGCDPKRPRLCDLWASAESQELAGVSPAMHDEFALQYERRLLAPFGLTGYGCCEDLTAKLDLVCAVPNMRRISISPFADVDKCAPRLGDKFIFSWKPHPAHVGGAFDPELIRRYIRHTLDVTRGCVLEMILKDTHTCHGHPERFDTWCQIARELVAEYAV